jgi:hypothetical protein
MAIPVILAPLVAGIVTGLSTFLASRGMWILAGMGLGFMAVTGLQTVAGLIIGDMVAVVGTLGGMGGAVSADSHLGVIMLQLAAYCGLFDALNIVIGGFVASYSLIGLRVALRRLNA